jgi:hypothetical protein
LADEGYRSRRHRSLTASIGSITKAAQTRSRGSTVDDQNWEGIPFGKCDSYQIAPRQVIGGIFSKSISNLVRKIRNRMNRDGRYGGARTQHIEDEPRVVKKLGIKDMVYAVDDGQLLNIWTAIRYLGEIREILDPADRSEVLTEAQALLTAFVLLLTPLPGTRSDLGQITRFDA